MPKSVGAVAGNPTDYAGLAGSSDSRTLSDAHSAAVSERTKSISLSQGQRKSRERAGIGDTGSIGVPSLRVPKARSQPRVGRRGVKPEQKVVPECANLAAEAILDLARLKIEIQKRAGKNCEPLLRLRLQRLQQVVGKIDAGWKKAIAGSLTDVLDFGNWALRVKNRKGELRTGKAIVVKPGSDPNLGYLQLRHARGSSGNIYTAEVVPAEEADRKPHREFPSI